MTCASTPDWVAIHIICRAELFESLRAPDRAPRMSQCAPCCPRCSSYAPACRQPPGSVTPPPGGTRHMQDALKPAARLPYEASVDRPRLALPNGKRVAVYIVVNVEHWEIDRPMPRQVLTAPQGASVIPDLPNWAWHEIRHARRLLAPEGGAGCAWDRALHDDQRHRAGCLSACRPCRARSRLGVHGSRLAADGDAFGGGPARHDPRHPGLAARSWRARCCGVAGAGPDRDTRFPRSAGGSGNSLLRRLGGGRPALHAAHRPRSAADHAGTASS